MSGYKLDLISPPVQGAPPLASGTGKADLIEEEVQKLLRKGAIKEVPNCHGQFLSRIFLVPKKDGSFRPVVNLRPLNRFMENVHFKMESLGMMRDLLENDDWMASIDLKDAYLSVAIWEEHRKYLRFPWRKKVYEFQCLPFGLSSAPRVFTKLLKPVLAHLRQQGIRLIMYLDDMLVMAQSRTALEKQLIQIISLLETLGFVVNREKSQLQPTQSIQYLGFLIDSQQMKILLTEEKIGHLSAACKMVRQQGFLSARELARLIGKLTATLPAIFPAPLWYRELQRLKNQALRSSHSFETSVLLTQEALLELDWWSSKMSLVNGKNIRTQEPDMVMETDASMLGWGAVCNGTRTGGLWSQVERRNHINYLELLAATFAVKAFTKNKSNLHLLLRMDNRTAICYVNHMGGTHSPLMSKLAIQLWQWCLERNLSLSAVHLPGTSNCVADEESRTPQSSAEWQLDQVTFCQIVRELGECNVDLFATRLNTKLTQFISWRPDPNAIGTDALQIPWDKYSGYAFPPFCLIGKCLRKAREERASLLLIAPVWRSQPWYPVLLDLLVDYPRLLPSSHRLLTDPFGNPHPLLIAGQLQLAAWKLSGRDSKRLEFQEKLHNSWQPDGAKGPMLHTRVHGSAGIAGVLNDKSIPFHALSSPSLSS